MGWVTTFTYSTHRQEKFIKLIKIALLLFHLFQEISKCLFRKISNTKKSGNLIDLPILSSYRLNIKEISKNF